MTEKEKMLAGELYDANYNSDLLRERQHAKNLCYDFNLLRPNQVEEQNEILRKLLGKIGKNIVVTAPFYCDYGYNINVGDNFYTNHNVVMLDCASITFGNNVFIAPNCGFYTAGHPISAELRNKGLEYAKPIKVGNDVWFGAGAHVMPGVTIGNNVVVAAGAVVTKSIPDNSLVAGVPAKVIKKL